MQKITRRLFGAAVSLGTASLALPTTKPSTYTPPFVVLVSGGKLSKTNTDKILACIEKHHRKGDFHQVLVLDTEPGTTISIRELRQEALDLLQPLESTS